MLTDEMKTLIGIYNAGSVATVNEDGSPSVSPKATFVVIDDATIAFGNIRSPGTVSNLRRRPGVEVCFTDVLTRKAVRVTGTAAIISKADAGPEIMSMFERDWGPYLQQISSFVEIHISAAELILSPAYDIGLTADELRATNLAKLNAL